MEILTDIIQLILGFFAGIFYYLFGFFFGAEPPATMFLKLFLLAQIAFLIYTSFRPAKWKWITLFATEAVLIIAGIVIFFYGITEDNLGIMGYGIVSGVWSFIMLVATLICNSRAPFALKRKGQCATTPPEDTAEA